MHHLLACLLTVVILRKVYHLLACLLTVVILVKVRIKLELHIP